MNIVDGKFLDRMKIKQIKIIVFFLLAGATFFSLPAATVKSAGEPQIVISPSIIDEQAEPRDILEYSISLKNNGQVKAELYPFVNDLTKKEGEQPFINPADLDKTVSLARWIEVRRAVVELFPGEEKTLPVKISINQAAKPGMYFAVISFGQGPNRDLAEKNKLETNQPEVILNIEVKEHVVEKAESSIFRTDRDVYFGKAVNFILSLKNIGNKEIRPQGKILIYDRRGAEVGVVEINREKMAIKPLADQEFKLSWQDGGKSGRYKAKLELVYGDSRKDINDTIYFWILPWSLLAIFLFLFFAVLISLWLLVARLKKHNQLLASQSVLSGHKPVPPVVINLRDRK